MRLLSRRNHRPYMLHLTSYMVSFTPLQEIHVYLIKSIDKIVHDLNKRKQGTGLMTTNITNVNNPVPLTPECQQPASPWHEFKLN